jgi:hypothetical protein
MSIKRTRAEGTEFSGKVKKTAILEAGHFHHGVCAYCDNRAQAEIVAGGAGEVDHIISKEFRHFAVNVGIEFDSLDNAIYVCRKCNNVKGKIEQDLDVNDFNGFIDLIWSRYAAKKWTNIDTRTTRRTTKAKTAAKNKTHKRVVHTITKTMDTMPTKNEDGTKNMARHDLAIDRANLRRGGRGNKTRRRMGDRKVYRA